MVLSFNAIFNFKILTGRMPFGRGKNKVDFLQQHN